MRVYEDREAAEELLYFKREDEKNLKNLLKKVRASQTPEQAAAAEKAEREALSKIVGKYKVSEEDVKGSPAGAALPPPLLHERAARAPAPGAERAGAEARAAPDLSPTPASPARQDNLETAGRAAREGAEAGAGSESLPSAGGEAVKGATAGAARDAAKGAQRSAQEGALSLKQGAARLQQRLREGASGVQEKAEEGAAQLKEGAESAAEGAKGAVQRGVKGALEPRGGQAPQEKVHKKRTPAGAPGWDFQGEPREWEHRNRK
eukprot:scaffold12.g7999.t1